MIRALINLSGGTPARVRRGGHLSLVSCYWASRSRRRSIRHYSDARSTQFSESGRLDDILVAGINDGSGRDLEGRENNESAQSLHLEGTTQRIVATNSRRDGHRSPHSVPHASRSRDAAGNKASRKRPSPLVARQAHPDRPSPTINEAYITKHMSIPTRTDYPTAPKDFDQYPKHTITSILARVLKTESKTSATRRGFRCTLTCKVPNREAITVVGEGLRIRFADSAAHLHLLAKLHQEGVLAEIWPADSGIADESIIQGEADAKFEVYNYCARFDAVPTFTVQMAKIPRLSLSASKKAVNVSIELAEQKIRASSDGVNYRAAEIAACVQFKRAAEAYYADQGNEEVVRDSSILTTANAKSFFEYYKTLPQNRGVEIAMETKAVGSGSMSRFESQVILDGERVGEAVAMPSKSKAEDVAYLTAAIALKKAMPIIYPSFVRALEAGNGSILLPLWPVDMTIDDEMAFIMRDTVANTRNAGLTDNHEPLTSAADEQSRRRARAFMALTHDEAEQRSRRLRADLERLEGSPELQAARMRQQDLPMNQFKSQVIELIDGNDYSIIVGATGSGKSTQVPQILLERATKADDGARCNIICTQPRRIAATSVARRVAEERDQPLRQSVGYQVRFDSRLPEAGGSITYCTTGVLLQQLLYMPDEMFDSTSHIVIDEVHERDILVDFLLVIVKKRVAERTAAGKAVPKVVLMSATMDVDLFQQYLGRVGEDGTAIGCSSLSVPGRAFPVREEYLDDILKTLREAYPRETEQVLAFDQPTKRFLLVEQDFVERDRRQTSLDNDGGADSSVALIDWKRQDRLRSDHDGGESERDQATVPSGLVALTIAHIARTTDKGAILAFLPGLDEIAAVQKYLQTARPLGINVDDRSRFKLSILHSSLPTGHDDVFKPVPAGCRKIILATNIAETSVTIPDVQYVIDSGKHREKRYDQVRRITKLQCTWISKANSKQRAGRAGRVQDGNYLALFGEARRRSLRAVGLPEILRSDLQDLCLNIKAHGFSSPVREFLSAAIEPPSGQAVDAAVMALQQMEALTEDEELTPLGRLLASLPVHPALGKMIVLGVIFRCLDPILILSAASGERQIFAAPLQDRQEAAKARRMFADGSCSDHVATINAFRQCRSIQQRSGRSAMMEFAMRNYLHPGAFRNIMQTANQIETVLAEARLIARTPTQQRENFEFGPPSLNANAGSVTLIKALALAGLHPNIAVALKAGTYRTRKERAKVFLGSVNAHGKQTEGGPTRGDLMVYTTMTKSADGGQLFLRDTSSTSSLAAALFGGRLRSRSASVLEMDDWLPFFVKSLDGAAVKTFIEFRKTLDRLLTNSFQDLSRRDVSQRGYLADVEANDQFARGLVDVLEIDQNDGPVMRGLWGQSNDQQDNSRGYVSARR
ncbi:MAG: hypothetical protein M1825_001214 [Sarcosagium campestre]|nr:MAG: hypothetical protein M1825_001214 [Sarcosagium campestre]